MSENLRILESSTDQDGKPFTFVKVPIPKLITEKIIATKNIDFSEYSLDLDPSWFIPSERPQEGDTLLRIPVASYLNYLVTNGLVILPTYTAMGTSEKREKQVEQIFKKSNSLIVKSYFLTSCLKTGMAEAYIAPLNSNPKPFYSVSDAI